MKTLIIPVLFVVMCAVQLFVPVKAIFDQEKIRSEGKEFKFETQPIDPTDPFRGAYITLRFGEEKFFNAEEDDWEAGDAVFVLLDASSGFAKTTGVSDSKPTSGDFVEAKVRYASHRDGRSTISIQFPFERFYLEESKAPKAENYYNDSQRDSEKPAYAVVRIKDGKPSLIDVRINEKSIVDIVRESNEKLKEQ